MVKNALRWLVTRSQNLTETIPSSQKGVNQTKLVILSRKDVHNLIPVKFRQTSILAPFNPPPPPF